MSSCPFPSFFVITPEVNNRFTIVFKFESSMKEFLTPGEGARKKILEIHCFRPTGLQPKTMYWSWISRKQNQLT